MPEQESIQTLEEEIRSLEEKLAARKMEGKEEKEVFRDVLREHVETAKKSVSSPTSAVSLHDYAAKAKNTADDLREKEHREQVEALVEIALAKGTLAAISAARHLDNPHLLDDFHDMLVDEYYEKLIQARKIT